MTTLDAVRALADSVLLEGAGPRPMRSAPRLGGPRFPFGVIAPRAWAAAGGGEVSTLQAECLVEGARPRVDVRLRFLHLERRVLERCRAGGAFEAVERLEVDGAWIGAPDAAAVVEIDLGAFDVGRPPVVVELALGGRRDLAPVVDPDRGRVGRICRTRRPLRGRATVASTPVEGAPGLHRLSIAVENRTPVDDPTIDREAMLGCAFLSAHALLVARSGGFVSLLDPPSTAREVARACRQHGWFPSLAGPPGERSLVLVSPFVLEGHAPVGGPEGVG